ncbi:hypothetical protein QTP70_020340 [Hemibagrus guttatus]|uniref:Immunoglobulin V-set domain-containing protein n=1 Tax=Hemibagrus guttatus TaxID=175788 RepID=A0AAE0UGS4_9TELE|nr:hypothetical protein QTP70_020340 [Hemibagrus guttatus]
MFTVIFMCLWLSLGDSMADLIEPLFTHKVVNEGDDVTLSCSYKNSRAVNNLQWLLTIALNQIKPMYFQWKAATSHCPAHILDQFTVSTGIDKNLDQDPSFCF